MVDNNTRLTTNRREILKYSATAGIIGLAGCSTTDDGGNGQDGGDGDDGSDGSDGMDGSDGDDGETATETEAEDGSDGDSGPYTIGMVDSLTGALTDFGQRNQRGKDLALSRINEVGLDGRELEIQVEDSGSKEPSGVSAAQNLINQTGVPFIIGAVGSGVSLSIYQSVVQNTDVVQLSQNSTGLGLTEHPDLLRISPSGRSQSIALTDIIADDGHDSVAVTWVNNNYGESLANAFLDNWDGEVAFKGPHNQEQASYSNLISQMASSGADAWVFVAYQQGFSTMVNNAYEGGYGGDVDYYGADSVRGETVINNTPEGSMDGMKIVTPSAPVEQDNYQEFASAFQDEYDKEPTSWAAYAYDCTVVAALSILAADEFTGAALSEVVRDVTRPEGEQVTSFAEGAEILENGGSASDVDYQGVSGPIDLNENGDPKGFLQVLAVRDHSYEGIDFIAG